ncbi:bile acid:sodium symporter family protein [Anaeroselena agilis]|uniref:Bile acid:sodium symporter family protein n=1 Tax=Anaeroselena agilis TaxID=3063788 RepID=A0ABU3P0C5_9FIRM|nr:bile acid:sodium symporter family protein [Selenomonadales bacterium 4137-cl]
MDFSKLNAWLGKKMYLGVLGALLLGFNSAIADSPQLRMALIVLFGYATFVTALETSLMQFGKVLSRPWISLWTLCLAHLGSPLMAWLMGYIFYPDDISVRIGYLVAASVPVGVTSVIWTSIVRGNVPVALVTLALDTVIVPFFLPAFFLVTVGQALHIDYKQMALQLMWMITIPSLVGMILHDILKEKAVAYAKGFGGVTAKVTFYVVIFFNAALVAPAVDWSPAILKMILITFFIVAASYFLGYLGSLVVRGRPRDVAFAMVYSIGIRNISSGLVLAIAHFPPAVAVPITLFMLFQQPLASIVPLILKPLPSPSGET